MNLPADDREAEAKAEIAATRLPQAVGRALLVAFGLLLIVPLSFELARDTRRNGTPWHGLGTAARKAVGELAARRPIAANRALHAGMIRFEKDLEGTSVVRAFALDGVQDLLGGVLQGGSEQVRVGHDGWLFLQSDVELVTTKTPPSGALAAMVRFRDDLASRGIELLVLPVPPKTMVHPEKLARRAVPSIPTTFARLVAELEAAEVAVLDPTELLVAAASESPMFLEKDSHWSPGAVELVARAVAQDLEKKGWLTPSRASGLERFTHTQRSVGDLVAPLGVPSGSALAAPQEVTLHPVRQANGATLRPSREAPVLLLGDSFSNVFSQSALGWGEGAGLAEQLAFELGGPVDRLSQNAGGAAATRHELARLLASGDDRLAGKRVVIYQFAARELATSDWPAIPLSPKNQRDIRTELAGGFVIWESNRTGHWRLYRKFFGETREAQLSKDEPRMEHCCAHLAPDGRSLAYLARPGVRDEYPENEVAGELRLITLDNGHERLLAPAKSYGWGNRAAVWRGLGELIYIGPDGRTRLFDLAANTSRPLTDEPRPELGWLLDASLSFATQAAPSFSLYDPESRRVLERSPLGGCEPFVSSDGRWGYWVAGGGGPIRRMRLEDRAVSVLTAQNDSRLPEGRRYTYFPMLAHSRRFLAYGASNGDHHHFRADYDIFVVPVDPAKLELAGPAVRVSEHPATDRYPDVWVPPLAGERLQAPPAPGSLRPTGQLSAPPPWPSTLDGLAWVWAAGDQPNLVRDRERGELVTYPLESAGQARLDRDFTLVLGEGRFVASEEASRRVFGMVGGARALTLEATLTTEQASTPRFEPVLRFGGEPANFRLGQQGGQWVVALLLGPKGVTSPASQQALAPVTPGVAQHLAVSYSRGELVAHLDSREVLRSKAHAGGFARWQPGPLEFGGSGFRGRAEGVALWSRVLTQEELTQSANRYREIRKQRAAPPERREVEAQLVACSKAPTLSEITPYRQALIVCEWQSKEGSLRVAHFALLDGERQEIQTLAPGAKKLLALEPFAAQRQLEGVVLRDTLPARAGVRVVWYAVVANR